MRHSGVPFAVVRPTALTEEPAGAELQIDQGDTIKVRTQLPHVESPSVACRVSIVKGAGATQVWLYDCVAELLRSALCNPSEIRCVTHTVVNPPHLAHAWVCLNACMRKQTCDRSFFASNCLHSFDHAD